MDKERARRLLARERARVERALADLEEREGADELSHADQHPADYATELFDEELSQGLAQRLRDELAAIERAEQRLREGRYGRSVVTGEPIPDERLRRVPLAGRNARG